MKVALGVTGCIAAYKSIEVMRGLQKEGVSVQTILTRSARNFVAPLTFEALSAEKVVTDMFEPGANLEILHIDAAQSIKLLAVVPATANALGKFAHGIADDFLSTLYLSCSVPVLLAPAMNIEMWRHPAVRENVRILKSRGHQFVDPEPGMLACGMQGEGRLAKVEVIVAAILNLLGSTRFMTGIKVLVTAGPTLEDLDPVRFLSNRSSGKMGYAVAQAAHLSGAETHLVSGPTDLIVPSGIQSIVVRSAAEMKDAVVRLYPQMDIVVMAAAVSDYRPAERASQKIKKDKDEVVLKLVPTEDILAMLGRRKESQILVGFAAETEDVLARARGKMIHKNLDMVVANDVSQGVFGADSATVHILSAGSETVTLQNQQKLSIANRILEVAWSMYKQRKAQPVS